MTKDRWTISLVLLNAFITFSQENDINTEIEGYDQEFLQNDAPPGMMVLPHDCFEVCNDYECLYLCPQPLRGVKRCITPLKSNKKSCCQNGQKDSSTGNDKLKTAGKHIWQAREQLLGIRKEIENDLANRRYSLMKGLQPLALRQHNRDPLPKLGTKTLKQKNNAVKPVCPVIDKKTTDSPNNCVNKNKAVLGGISEDKYENNIPQKLPFYENGVSEENESGQLSEYNDEIILSTTTVPVLENEMGNIEDVSEQVSGLNSDSLEGIEGKKNSFMDVSGTQTSTLESEHTTYNADSLKSSYYKDCKSDNAEQSNNENLLHQPKPVIISNSGLPLNYNYEEKTPNGEEIEATTQNIFQSDSLIFYSSTDRIGPMQIENGILSQVNKNDFLLTTPSMPAHSSTESNTAKSIKPVQVNSRETFDSPATAFRDTATPEIIENISEKNDNILVESNNELLSNNISDFTYNGSFSSLTTKGNSESYISNIEESSLPKIDSVVTKTPSDNLERILPGSYRRSEEDEHSLLTPSKLSKFDVNFLMNNETCVQNEIKQPNITKNESYVDRDILQGSSNKMDVTEHSDDYLNDDGFSNTEEKSQNNGLFSEINSSSAEDKNSLLEKLKLTASTNDQKQNYTYRILQELITKYNITSDLKGGENNAPESSPLNSLSENETPKQNETVNSSLIGQSTDILQNETNENESNTTIDYTTNSQYSSYPIKNEIFNFEVENDGKVEPIHMPSTTEINNQILSVTNNNSTYNLKSSETIPVESHSDISKSFSPSHESGESNGATYPRVNTTHGPLKAFPSITKPISEHNISDTIVNDNVNETSLENGTASGDRMVINPPHPQISRTEQATTTGSVYFVPKVSLENPEVYDKQLFVHPNQLNKAVYQIETNETDEEVENKYTNINEKQYNVESNIEEPMFEKNFSTSNESANEMNNPAVVDQELLYDAGYSESSNINSFLGDHIDKLSVAGSIDQKPYNETDENDMYDQTEKVLQLIPNGPEIQSSITSDDKRTEIKDQGIDEVHLRLEENNENSSRSIENDNDYNLYRPKHSDEISELNDSESYTLEDKRDDSNVNKKKMSEIINTELNSLKQQNIILKKREEEEGAMSYGDDPQCDCEYSTSRDEEADRYPSPGQYIDRANNYPHPAYPMVIVIPVPYPVCDCGNKTKYNSLNSNHIYAPQPYVSREHSEHLPDYPINSIYNNVPSDREGKAVRVPPYMPNFFLPFAPWEGMYSMTNPYQQVMYQPYENGFREQDEMNENEEKLDPKSYSNDPSSEEVLKNSYLEAIEKSLEESVATSKSPETPRFSRNEAKKTGTKYEFVDGQYVKIFRDDKDEGNGDDDKTEERPTTVPPTSITDSPTTATYISTNQEPLSVDKVVNSGAMNINDNNRRPFHYFYPTDFGGAQNNFFGGRQHAFADKNETNVSKTYGYFMDFKENYITEEPKKDHYIGKNENTNNNSSTVSTDSTWPSFADLLNQMNSTKIHHYKHHHKHRWWLHISHHLEKMKAKVRLKSNDTKRWQEERLRNFVFRKEKVSDVSIPILVISDKKQYRKRQKSLISAQTEYTPRKIRHET